jgi:hypothetical protein
MEVFDLRETAEAFFRHFNERYLEPLQRQVELDLGLLETVAGFLIIPKKVIVYFTKNHIVVEYEGPDRLNKLPEGNDFVELQIFDYAELDDPFSEIIGFNYSDGTSGFNMPLSGGLVYDDLIIPTNRALERLLELGWNTGAQDHILSINGGGVALVEGQSARIINGLFFDAPQEGLLTRHIKWADCIPIKRMDLGETWQLGYSTEHWGKQAILDARFNYYVPTEYRLRKLPYVNRFIEFYSAPNRSEPEITAFLAQDEFQFILTMRFGCTGIISQPELEWQSEKQRKAIKPDFLLIQSDGHVDICEFKLPRLKSNSVVGIENRTSFSAELSNYVAQTRVYQEYFDDPNNRAWLEEKYEVKAYKPIRYLIAGERSGMRSDDWRKIASDFRDLRLLNYNDLVDGVVAQFYK